MTEQAAETPQTCASCGAANREGARFCGECGAGLEATIACPACGSANPLGQRFCNDCGGALEAGGEARPGAAPVAAQPEVPDHLSEKMRDHGARVAGERKQVTVLFADVMGSMELAERIDPEQWREIMDSLFQLLADAVHRFEGTVDKFTGDGIMALFGAPIAHEDHAQRACFAALEMRKALGDYAAELRRSEGISLSVRIGINSGEVVVGSIGDDLSLDYTAIGHTVGLAQRMESLAEPGTAYATEYTARLAEGFVALDDLGEFEIKGSSKPLRVYALAGTGAAGGRLGAARRRGFSPFVGRADELAELEGAVERALAGEGGVVGIVGEAGVGKSRLCHELVERARARGVTIYEAQCMAHARNLPLLPVLQFQRAYYDIEPGDSDREVREKIAGRLLLLDPDLADDLGLVFEFLAVPDPQRPAPQMNPEARQRRLLELVRRQVHAQGREGPAITLVEDLHWIDPASEAFLAALVDAVPGTQTLVVTNFRPEYTAPWTSRSSYRQLPLAPLGEEALAELLSDLLGADPSLDGLADLVRERSSGNPFFVEEIVRELDESGALDGEQGAYRLVSQIDDLSVPPSVQTILAARIDRLDASEKKVLAAAAAIGGEFRRDMLALVVELDDAALDASLRALIESEFIYETALYPEPEYEFRHPLTREVAYGSQLAGARAAAHAAIARGLQKLEPERLDERAALIAQHFEEAGEGMDAARWYARAAGWTGFNDPPAAYRHWQRVRELDSELPEEDPEADALRLSARLMLVATGWRLGVDVEDVRTIFEEGKAITDRTGDHATLAFMYGGLGFTVGTSGGDFRECIRICEEAARIAGEVDDPLLHVAASSFLVYPCYLVGRYSEALEAADRVLELTAEDPQLGAGVVVTNARAWAMSFRSLPLIALGRFEEARKTLAEGAELCRRWDRESLGWTHNCYCALAEAGGEVPGPETLAHGRQSIEIAEQHGDSFSRVTATGRLGAMQRLVGDREEAERTLERCLAMVEETSVGLETEAYARRDLSVVLAARGELERAVAEGELALKLCEERGLVGVALRARQSLALILIERGENGDADRAAALLDEAEEGARELGARADLGAVLKTRAALCQLRGDQAGREQALSEALDLAREMDARGLLPELEAEAGSPA